MLLLALPARAQPPAWLTSTNAVEFFTNLSTRLLLATGYGFDAGNIPVYSNGHFVFTPDVHRVLQVAANIYDASTNRADRGGPEFPFLPSVFRPVFRVANGNVFIGGWVEETGGTRWAATPRELNSPADAAVVQPDDNLYDVPWIIGVKKGFPTFNEFSLTTVATMSRALQLVKPTLFSLPNRTNQLFRIGISNQFGFEAWNPYRSNYARAVDLIVANHQTVEFRFTNDALLDPRGNRVTQDLFLATWTNLPALSWAGVGVSMESPVPASFVVPLQTNLVFLHDAVLRSGHGGQPLPPTMTGPGLLDDFEDNGLLPVPELELRVTNRIRCYLVDAATGRLVDYVTLGSLPAHRSLSTELALPVRTDAILWDSSRPSGATLTTPPAGVLAQIQVALGNLLPSDADWRNYGLHPPTGLAKQKAIDAFRVFCGLTPLFSPIGPVSNLVMTAPFTPVRRISRQVSWQANDPLVHSLAAQLGPTNQLLLESLIGPSLSDNLGRLNERFAPWSRNFSVAPWRTNPLVKDPLLRRADDWADGGFGPVSLAWLGRVHRGTPWQSLYLKSGRPTFSHWTNWLGAWEAAAADRAMPPQDWKIAAEIARLLNLHHPAILLPIGETDTNAWLQTLDGLSVLTNISSSTSLMIGAPPQFAALTVASNEPGALAVAEAIRQFQQNGAQFRQPGDLLALPELSLASPWLDRSSDLQLESGITDDAYEMLPAQLLSRLRHELELQLTRSGTTVTVSLSGYDGFPCVIEAGPDLVSWQPVSTNLLSNGSARFEEAAPPTDAQRFYRARWLP